MKKKIIFLLSLLILFPTAFAQNVSFLSSKNLKQEMNYLFEQSRQGNTEDIALQLQTTLSSHPVLAPSVSTTYSQTNNSSAGVSSSQSQASPTVSTPWQVAIFLAVDDENRLAEGLGVLRHQVNRGTLRHAVLLDIAPRANASVRKTAQLYFIHRKQGKTVTQKRAISTDIALEELLEALFTNLKAQEDSLYTGIIFSAHGSGFDMGYNEDYGIEVNDILFSAHQQKLHINVLELDSCHMSSLYTTYYASHYQNIDFLSGSSDYEYGTPANTRLFPILSFLNHEPKEAVRLAVASRLRQFDFLNSGYDTTSYSAVYIPSLQQALLDWYQAYVFLQKSTDEKLVPVFNSFLKDKDSWRSLQFIVRKQKEYVVSHFDELESNYPRFDTIKHEFIAASDNLLQALTQSTLIQWCYSSKRDRIYQGPSAGTADCLQSISVSRYQFEQLWEEQAEELEDDWRYKTRVRRFRG